MKRRVLASMLASVALIGVLASPAAASHGSGTGGVSVSATVNAKVDYTVVDRTHIELRSNAPWRLDVATPGGTVTMTGQKNARAVRIDIPADATSFVVVTEH
ncbi:MAG: hypothetical protein Q7W30_10845 [Coriobacteriia bacterium]|nr:hypothetical protein [Coriobacteriia bacterium]